MRVHCPMFREEQTVVYYRYYNPWKPIKNALFSKSGTHRYALSRVWDVGGDGGMCTFIMLNPSTADVLKDDPTIRRCIGFAKAWGCCGLTVVNLFALRSTDPKALTTHPEPIGLGNDAVIAEQAFAAATGYVVAAWGTHGALWNRGAIVADMIGKHRHLYCLGMTKDGHPKHPLYVSAATPPQVYREPAKGKDAKCFQQL